VQRHAGGREGRADLADAVEEWNDNLARSAPRPNPGPAEMLEYVATSGIVVGVVSAAKADVVRADVAALGFDTHISFVLGGVESKSEILMDPALGLGVAPPYQP
jgi:phosphoglycolate phosphatase-like HAD superfamily hydrolase